MEQQGQVERWAEVEGAEARQLEQEEVQAEEAKWAAKAQGEVATVVEA